MHPTAPTREEAQQAVALLRAGAVNELEPLARGFTLRHPAHPLGWMLLGAALKQLGRATEAIAPLERAAILLPDKADPQVSLGAAHQAAGRHAEAEACYRRALTLQPTHADALYNLAELQAHGRRAAEAEASYRALLRVQPADAAAWAGLGVVLAWQERWAEAEAAYREALRVGPPQAEVFDNLSHALLEQGRGAEALAAMQQAVALEPDAAPRLSNLLFTACYVPGASAQVATPARRYGELLARTAHRATAWRCDPQPKRLRVGLVSGDLRRHAVSSFLASLLPHAEAARLELYAYATNAQADDVTAQLRPRFAAWRGLAGLDTEAAARTIRDDGVHVLVDLSGHTAHHRLDVFAAQPAPVQVSWLGSIATTGVAAMQYVLTDPHASPPGDERFFTESLWRLPAVWACFAPPQAELAEGELPARTTGHVTFGSFNNLLKFSEPAIAAWAGVLHAVPGARLYLKNKQFRDAALADQVAARFAAAGIARERLLLQGPVASAEGHLAEYRRIDIALDTFPYPGCTTSVEAHYMGVPVVTLRGSGALLRLGESVAAQLGLQDWVAPDVDAYVERAVRAAADLDALAALRAKLRGRMRASALLDAPRFARDFGEALWAMWERRAAA